jgi:transposase
MRILQVKPYLTDTELKEKMNHQKRVDLFKDYQIIYSVQTNFGKKADDIAKILGITKNKVFKTVEKYNKYGMEWKNKAQRGGRRKARCIMSLQEEVSFLKGIEEESLKGQIITYKQIKDKLELAIQRTVSDDYIWDLFKRHNWIKKVPHQSHPQADKAAQEKKKKNFRNYWFPNH